MKNLILLQRPYKDDEILDTRFEYEIDDCITVDGDEKFICIGIEETENVIIYIFKMGIVSYDFSW